MAREKKLPVASARMFVTYERLKQGPQVFPVNELNAVVIEIQDGVVVVSAVPPDTVL